MYSNLGSHSISFNVGNDNAPIGSQPLFTLQRNSPSLSFLARAKAFLGLGRGASKTRREFVSMLWTFIYGFAQIVAIIVILIVASLLESPTEPNTREINACGRPLVAWNAIWIARVCLSCLLAYWQWRRCRNAERHDVESGNLTSTTSIRRSRSSQPSRQAYIDSTSGRSRNRSRDFGATSSPSSQIVEDQASSHPHLYSRMSMLSSMFTLTWFLTAHVLEYTSVDTCRLSAPHIWWLTFALLCTMYYLVLEVVLFGLLVFIVMPIIVLLYSILLLCLGRHPLQNPNNMTIKPEIEKLSKTTVDLIPLVMYIPPPPDDANPSPISLPEPIHSYPPILSTPRAAVPKRRFAFLPSKAFSKKGTPKNDDESVQKAEVEKKNISAVKEVAVWENNWERGEYPFVRLEGNRAACAICLMDFEEPKRIDGGVVAHDIEKEEITNPEQQPSGSSSPFGNNRIAGEIVEDRTASPRLEDAGEGPQPLRLLACGHVFHQTCVDPWLIDVSGRCPVCQRPVEISEPESRRRRRRSHR